ncbi:MAG: hypothetical protein QW123_00590 [Desulfurococcaceae archaeon]
MKKPEGISRELETSQLKRYSKVKAKLIMVTDVEEGSAVEVWGLREFGVTS